MTTKIAVIGAGIVGSGSLTPKFRKSTPKAFHGFIFLSNFLLNY